MEWRLFADLAETADARAVSIDLDGSATVEDALEALVATHPALEDQVLPDGELAEHLTVLRNGINVQTEAEGLSTRVDAGDELALFPPISGG